MRNNIFSSKPRTFVKKMRLLVCLSFLVFLGCSDSLTNSTTSNAHSSGYNHLKGESSPYLLQHAQNPVDWYPWKEEALAKAKEENKMLLISIGYSACHWCHVMEHESFEDSTVAAIMNEHFVSIKVDREERPDIDDVYMTACQMATGKGCGWPLNAFALPDGRPVWAGTYFPRKQWKEIMEYFIDLRQKEPAKLEEYALELTKGLQNSEVIEKISSNAPFKSSTQAEAAKRFVSGIDQKWGGRSGAPKFPMPNNYEWLLAYSQLMKDQSAQDAALFTLDKMAAGGIYDHLGGGFARYSVDDQWHVPHFEKMLYDNAQLVSLYAQAHQLTKNPKYAQVIEETITFLKRELTDPTGGFYSSLDADSEGEEGKFYVWTDDEIKAILTDPDTYKLFAKAYDIQKRGNWEDDKNVLRRKISDEELYKWAKQKPEEVETTLADARKRLFDARSKRIRPGLDDKILTSWNALMIRGLVDAHMTLGQSEYKEMAIRNGQFIRSQMLQSDGRLNRNFKDGKSSINAFLDDYALTIEAFVALYEITFDESWLNDADQIAQYAVNNFSEETSGMFYYTSNLDPPVVARKKEITDNVIPGSNSAIAKSLFVLGTYLYKPAYIQRSEQMLQNLTPTLIEIDQPGFYSNWFSLHLLKVKVPYEIAILGPDSESKAKEMQQNYLPNAFFLGGTSEGNLELLSDKLVEGETMIYVCQNKVCQFPKTEVSEALKLLR